MNFISSNLPRSQWRESPGKNDPPIAEAAFTRRSPLRSEPSPDFSRFNPIWSDQIPNFVTPIEGEGEFRNVISEISALIDRSIWRTRKEKTMSLFDREEIRVREKNPDKSKQKKILGQLEITQKWKISAASPAFHLCQPLLLLSKS